MARKKLVSVRRGRLGAAITMVACLGCASQTQLAEERRTGGATDAGTGDSCRTGAIAVAAGAGSTCALTAGGTVKCWGSNIDGQVGDGSTVGRAVPVNVLGLSSGVLAISTGAGSSCALTAPGAVKCWGANTNGQLGDGSTSPSSVPVDVVGQGSDTSAISARGPHTCALTVGGALRCWGFNGSGELGNGSFASSPVPVDVVTLSSNIIAVSAGGYHTCALTSAGAVKCWGANGHGELGTSWASAHEVVPIDAVGLTPRSLALSAGGYHACALAAAGSVKCWGWNQDGQLGNGSYSESPTLVPVDVVGLSSGIVAISAGWQHTCAITTAGSVKYWGANGYGELGNGSTAFSNVPVDVVGLSSGIIAVSAGTNHSCAVTAAGSVKCWGWNQNGQLGIGSVGGLSPVAVDVIGL